MLTIIAATRFQSEHDPSERQRPGPIIPRCNQRPHSILPMFCSCIQPSVDQFALCLLGRLWPCCASVSMGCGVGWCFDVWHDVLEENRTRNEGFACCGSQLLELHLVIFYGSILAYIQFHDTTANLASHQFLSTICTIT